jgi:hypothetical protein
MSFAAPDPTYNLQAPVYLTQGANELHVSSGAYLVIEPGGVFVNQGVQAVAGVQFTIPAGSSNTAAVSCQLVDGGGNAVAAPFMIEVFLSDSATGVGLTATTASGAVGCTTPGTLGTDFGTLTAKKALLSQTNGSGVYSLSIVDTANTGFYVGVAVGSKVYVSPQLTIAAY